MKKYFVYGILLFMALGTGCHNVSKYPIDAPRVKVDTNLIGIWKMQEDTNAHDFFVIEKSSEYKYVITYMNREGSNRVFENFPMYFSEIGGKKFLDVGYSPNMDHSFAEAGYFFMKVIEHDPRGFNFAIEMYKDTALKNCKSQEEVKARIVKNMGNPAFYEQPVHFHKILPLMYCK